MVDSRSTQSFVCCTGVVRCVVCMCVYRAQTNSNAAVQGFINIPGHQTTGADAQIWCSSPTLHTTILRALTQTPRLAAWWSKGGVYFARFITILDGDVCAQGARTRAYCSHDLTHHPNPIPPRSSSESRSRCLLVYWLRPPKCIGHTGRAQ